MELHEGTRNVFNTDYSVYTRDLIGYHVGPNPDDARRDGKPKAWVCAYLCTEGKKVESPTGDKSATYSYAHPVESAMDPMGNDMA